MMRALWSCHRTRLLVLAVAVSLLVLTGDALARVGGGETFSSGGGGGFSGGGGGGGGEGEILFYLIWLALEYPAIGIPLLILFVLFLILRWWFQQRGTKRAVHRSSKRSASTAGRIHIIPGVAELTASDHGFSLPVLLDYLQILHRRGTEAAVTKEWGPLLPYIEDDAKNQLKDAHRDVTAVEQVVLGSIRIEQIQKRRGLFLLTAQMMGTRREVRNGSPQRVYVEERWTFKRSAAATSPQPDRMTRMGCPACGAALDVNRMGNCEQCGTSMAAGQHQWAAISVDFGIRQSVRPPKVGLTQGGKEPSWDAPSAIDPALGKAFRALEARHPDFDVDTFHARVRVMFATLQDAWSSQQWDRARPYVTDTLFQTLRFWIEQYEEHGLVNRLDDIELDKIAFIRIQRDAWYEAITVRIWGRMKDYVVDKQGDVVGGNKNRQRLFSEYWTLLRSIGTGAACGDPLQCPSCGAALDQISQTGVCGYCETKITSGQFDWVLTRIDHAELGPS